MSTWPETLQLGPIREWPGTLTRDRRAAPFRSALTATLKLLDREIYELADTRSQQTSAELLVAMQPGMFRLDGRPRADARAEHPGVVFSMDTRHGRLSYPCDTFTTWQDNLRAIALALEALRKVDRYGVTRRGEQYRGFLALEGTAATASFATADDALAFLKSVTGVYTNTVTAAAYLRGAQRRAHPDTGGDPATFHRVSLAETKLREAGRL